MKFQMAMLAGLSFVLGTSTAHAQCQDFVGTVAATTSFEPAASVLRNLPTTRGEYEATVDFEARVANAMQALPSALIIPGIFSEEYAVYDADSGVLNIQAYALRNVNTSYEYVFGYGSPFYGEVEYSTLGNRGVVVFQGEEVTGSYTASNAFGAATRVTEITRTHHAIFEGETARYNETFFVEQQEGAGAQIGAVPMSIPDAQAFKATGQVAFVVAPKWPFYAEGVRSWEPTISNPTDVTQPISVIVADIQCGLLLLADNTVIAAFETR